MSEAVAEAVRAAVNVARTESIRAVPQLRSRLSQMGYDEPTIKSALLMWADHIRREPYLH